MRTPVLSLDRLTLHVRTETGARLKIVEDVSFDIMPGQFYALIGESGSGKSMIARAIMRLMPDEVLEIDGAIRFEGRDLAKAREKASHLLETAVYLELRRRGRSLSYVSTRSGYEVDFLSEDSRGSRELIQVCAILDDPATRQRELRALEEGLTETSCESATLVTLREEGTVTVGGSSVRIVPAWRWMLEPLSNR